MGWEDRDYHRRREPGAFGSGGVTNLLGTLLTGSFPFGTYFGIRVRVHYGFVLLLLFELLHQASRGGSVVWVFRRTGLLFLAVLLHEFGHCFACRWVGGTANDILMWPLGGLAFTLPPRRPWPEFVTVACGPLVNIVLAGACYLTVWLSMDVLFSLDVTSPRFFEYAAGATGLVYDFFLVNLMLAIFNMMLIFYPFDAGRLIQIVLWVFVGYQRSMVWATSLGMAGAGVVAVLGFMSGNVMLVLIAVFGFVTCMQQASQLRAAAHSGPEFDPGYYDQTPPRKAGWMTRWRQARVERSRQQTQSLQAREEAEVDRILAKVKDHGLHSLSEKEKRTLQHATERQRRAG